MIKLAVVNPVKIQLVAVYLWKLWAFLWERGYVSFRRRRSHIRSQLVRSKQSECQQRSAGCGLLARKRKLKSRFRTSFFPIFVFTFHLIFCFHVFFLFNEFRSQQLMAKIEKDEVCQSDDATVSSHKQSKKAQYTIWIFKFIMPTKNLY